MQMRFAEYYVFGDENGPMTKTEAATKAGYSPKRARQEGESQGEKLTQLSGVHKREEGRRRREK